MPSPARLTTSVLACKRKAAGYSASIRTGSCNSIPAQGAPAQEEARRYLARPREQLLQSSRLTAQLDAGRGPLHLGTALRTSARYAEGCHDDGGARHLQRQQRLSEAESPTTTGTPMALDDRGAGTTGPQAAGDGAEAEQLAHGVRGRLLKQSRGSRLRQGQQGVHHCRCVLAHRRSATQRLVTGALAFVRTFGTLYCGPG
eukprot:scaffold631_cov378-Prasinococcus_capsulatus_cf.AAC.8